MSTVFKLFFSTAVVSAVGAPALWSSTDICFNLDFVRMQGSADFLNSGATSTTPYVFYARPWSYGDSTFTSLHLSSSDGQVTGEPTGSGSYYATFADSVATITGGAWQFTVNGTETYAFGLSLGTLAETAFPQISVTGPAVGSTDVSLTPTYQWTVGDGGLAVSELFTSVGYEVIRDFNGGFSYPAPIDLGLNDTSLTTAAQDGLLAGSSYGFNIIYTRDASEITLNETPYRVDADGNAMLDTEGNLIPLLDSANNPVTFHLNATLYDQGTSVFTTIPEPSTYALMFSGLSLVVVAARRMRRRALT